MANLIKYNYNSIFGHNIRHLYLKYDLSFEDILNMPMKEIKTSFYCKYDKRSKSDEKLYLYRHFQYRTE